MNDMEPVTTFSGETNLSSMNTGSLVVVVGTLPSVEDLMPRLSFAEVAGESQPPVAERLLSSNALRQARFRERRAAALHNVTEPLQVADVTGSNDGGAA